MSKYFFFSTTCGRWEECCSDRSYSCLRWECTGNKQRLIPQGFCERRRKVHIATCLFLRKRVLLKTCQFNRNCLPKSLKKFWCHIRTQILLKLDLRKDLCISFTLSSADISITLRNTGRDAYKPEVFGQAIIIDLRITREGMRTFKLKSKSGKCVNS